VRVSRDLQTNRRDRNNGYLAAEQHARLAASAAPGAPGELISLIGGVDSADLANTESAAAAP